MLLQADASALEQRSHPRAARQSSRLPEGAGATAGILAFGDLGRAGMALSQPALPSPDASGIEHVVVLMMENRSFDHYLGWPPNADGRQEGLTYIDDTAWRTIPTSWAIRRALSANGWQNRDDGRMGTAPGQSGRLWLARLSVRASVAYQAGRSGVAKAVVYTSQIDPRYSASSGRVGQRLRCGCPASRALLMPEGAYYPRGQRRRLSGHGTGRARDGHDANAPRLAPARHPTMPWRPNVS